MQIDSLKTRILKTFWQVSIILIGSSISAIGISLLLKPHKLLSGGVIGTSLLLSYFTPIDPGYYVAALNIPLFIIAWRKIDAHFCIYSMLGTLSLAGALIVLDNLHFGTVVSDPLLSSLFGAMLSGGGTGLVIRARGSHGGTDIVSVVLRQRISVSIGMMNFYINLILVAILSLKFGLEIGLITLFAQYVGGRALDRVVTGLNTAKAITIISDHADEIANYIMQRMYRGVTFLEGEGAYEKVHKKVIWCVVTTSQLSRVKAAMKKIDPHAFMSISDASEILGKGFYRSPF